MITTIYTVCTYSNTFHFDRIELITAYYRIVPYLEFRTNTCHRAALQLPEKMIFGHGQEPRELISLACVDCSQYAHTGTLLFSADIEISTMSVKKGTENLEL